MDFLTRIVEYKKEEIATAKTRIPESGLREIGAFLGLDLSDADLGALAAGVEPERALAFRGDPQLVRLYQETAHHPLMQRLEYGDLSCLPAS